MLYYIYITLQLCHFKTWGLSKSDTNQLQGCHNTFSPKQLACTERIQFLILCLQLEFHLLDRPAPKLRLPISSKNSEFKSFFAGHYCWRKARSFTSFTINPNVLFINTITLPIYQVFFVFVFEFLSFKLIPLKKKTYYSIMLTFLLLLALENLQCVDQHKQLFFRSDFSSVKDNVLSFQVNFSPTFGFCRFAMRRPGQTFVLAFWLFFC